MSVLMNSVKKHDVIKCNTKCVANPLQKTESLVKTPNGF